MTNKQTPPAKNKKAILTVKDILAIEYNGGQLNKYRIEQYTNDLNLVKELNALGFKAKMYYYSYHDCSKIYLDEKNDIEINGKNYRDHYWIFSNKSFKYIDYNDKFEIPRPNNFKVLNKKTIQKWIDFCLELNKARKEKSIIKQNKVKDYLKKTSHLFNWYSHNDNWDITSGSYENKFIRYTFTIESSGYVSTKAELQFGYSYDFDKTMELIKKTK